MFSSKNVGELDKRIPKYLFREKVELLRLFESLSENKKNDQKRVSSPGQAVVNGSSILVVGRPITTSPNPIKSIEEILSNIRENIESRN